MENASKALIIAGGVLLSILLISALLATYNQINENQMKNKEVLATKQLADFNAYYESYNKKVVYGAEILTLLNKADEDGGISICDNNGNAIYKNTFDEEEREKTYRCNKIEYEEGRVSALYFEKTS